LAALFKLLTGRDPAPDELAEAKAILEEAVQPDVRLPGKE
jgi:hypothetical protein